MCSFRLFDIEIYVVCYHFYYRIIFIEKIFKTNYEPSSSFSSRTLNSNHQGYMNFMIQSPFTFSTIIDYIFNSASSH